jgi:hypothetical protein
MFISDEMNLCSCRSFSFYSSCTQSELTQGSGTFVFESGHVIELVTKIFLVIQNATSRIPEIEFATE